MRRVIAFGTWKERWWRHMCTQRFDEDEALMEGPRAYALEHADTELEIRVQLEAKWAGIRKRTETVLSNLSSSIAPDTSTAQPLILDLENDLEDEPDEYIDDEQEVQEEQEEQEVYELIA